MESIYNCAECGKETDYMKYASTQCSVCKKDFCCAMTDTCFSEYHKKSGCKGSHLTILDPTHTITLVSTKNEKKDISTDDATVC